MRQVRIPIKRLSQESPLALPRYVTEGSSGMDLYAALQEKITILPGERALIPTGIAVAIPKGFEGQIRPRSGLALRNGIGVVNSPGTIDADYRGEIGVLLINFGKELFIVRPGDRIAQMVISPVFRANWAEVDDLPPSQRKEGGFGHTGI